MSGPFTEEPTPLSARLIEYYRRVMTVHADDPVLRACLVCKRSRCPDWRYARTRLVCAGAPLVHDEDGRAAGACSDGS